jgi:hypothetical protein
MKILRESLGKNWVSNSTFGTKLHKIVHDLILQRFSGIPGITVIAEEKIASFRHVPLYIQNMTVEEYVSRTSGLEKYIDELRPLFEMKNDAGKSVPRLIKDLKPDLVIRTPGELVVWDLTTFSKTQHLAKTILYTNILGEGGQMCRIGETYWKHFPSLKRPFVPENLYPATFEAASVQKQKARALQADMSQSELAPEVTE